MARKKTVRDIDVAGKAVLVRVDYNVPFHPGTTDISDDSRIRASLDTVRLLSSHGARIVLCTHIGRPRGRVVESLRVAPVANRLTELLGQSVQTLSDDDGVTASEQISLMHPGDVALLENLRFHPEEESNDAAFAMKLASLANIYVDDAFGTAHRAHASTEGVTRYLPSVAGLLMDKELEMLGQALQEPAHPFVVVLGGAKVADKIGVIENLA
ncbi:MAG TPA: phosphoglycerate kinase, partial [SAR202 cluster bacterium]|nr:phosphoglycerate kinase [SAR202 cluster bacterium]